MSYSDSLPEEDLDPDKKKNEWSSQGLMVDLFPTMESSSTVPVDIASLMMPEELPGGGAPTRKGMTGPGYWLSPHLKNEKTDRAEILAFFANPCRLDGFKLITMATRPNSIQLACNRSRVEAQPSGKGIRNIQSQRPKCKAECCPFRFTVMFHTQMQRWYLPKMLQGSMKHQFHSKVIAKDDYRNDILAQILESPYTWYTPKFKHITELIKTPADVEIMDQCLNEIRQKLMSSAKVCASQQSAQNDPSDDVPILERQGQYTKRKRQQGEGR